MAESIEFDVIIVYINGKELRIETSIMDEILHYLNNHKFQLKDFSQYKTEKEVLDYYYNKEKECLGYMTINFEPAKEMQEFFINFTKEIVVEKYRNNQQISNIKNNIDLGINKIIEEYKKNDKLNINDLPDHYYKQFKTKKIPQFLENKLIEEIKSIQIIKELNKSNINIDLKKNDENKELIDYYIQILNGKTEPFLIGDKNVLFNIFLYSNLEDIYKNDKIKNIILTNYYEISKCFLNNWENIDEFQEAINNKKDMDYIRDKLKDIFKQYEINDSHIYILASYFYLVFNSIKDTSMDGKNGISFNNKIININNPLLNKIMKNIIKGFSIYCSNQMYNSDIYLNMINYFNNYIIVNSLGQKENKLYDFSEIKNKIKKYDNDNHLDNLMNQIYMNENYHIVSKILNSKINTIFNDAEFTKSVINLIPVNKKRNTNTITILISGFLSQCDDINSWELFYNFDKRNSSYYIFRWPSSDISVLIAKSLLFIFNAATIFIQCKKKAKYAGKILAWFLASNEEFNNCIINIAGFSLGGQVVKYCIKELDKIRSIKGHTIKINNALFLAAAADMREDKKNKWRNIFRNNVSGRVISCFSRFDWVLGNLYKICAKNDHLENKKGFLGKKKDPIGLNKMNLKDEKGEYDIVEDYDFSDLKLGHTDYRKRFTDILQRINFLNSN